MSNPCIRGIQEDQAEDQAVGDEVAGDALKIHKIKVAPTLSGYNSGSLGEVELDSGYNSGDDSDDCDSGKALVDVETASSAAMQARIMLTLLCPLHALRLSTIIYDYYLAPGSRFCCCCCQRADCI